jgi:hypothetical protein
MSSLFSGASSFVSDYFSQHKELKFLTPVNINKLDSTSDNPYLHLTFTTPILRYLKDTGAYSYYFSKINEYPLYLSIKPSVSPEVVFMHDFIRGAVEIEGVSYSKMNEWVDLKEDANPKSTLVAEFLSQGFFRADILAVLNSYQQILLYTNRYILESMFSELFYTPEDLEANPEDKWHINSVGLTLKFNIFKKSDSIFAELKFANMSLNHMRWGEYFIPGALKTFFYLDQSEKKAPTWRMYQHFFCNHSLVAHMSFLESIHKSLEKYCLYDYAGGSLGAGSMETTDSKSWQMVFLQSIFKTKKAKLDKKPDEIELESADSLEDLKSSAEDEGSIEKSMDGFCEVSKKDAQCMTESFLDDSASDSDFDLELDIEDDYVYCVGVD